MGHFSQDITLSISQNTLMVLPPEIEHLTQLTLRVNRVKLPPKYSRCHPSKWSAEWILSESNVEIRRLLIQSIGYAKIEKEFQAIELDSWQEYTLLRINAGVDIEPVFLLKMTCPSTGYIHVLRVPPHVETARSAIKWVNWGVDPEEFSVQS